MPDEYAPWTVKGEVRKREEHWNGWTGVLPAFVETLALDFELNLTLRDHFASAQSKEKFPGSSFTSCVMDVRVGSVDICVGNFWVTAERLSLTQFVQPFGADNLYLVASNTVEEPGFWDYMVRPFKPFFPELWLYFWLFVVFAGLTSTLIDYQSDDFENPHLIPRFCKAAFLTWHGLFRWEKAYTYPPCTLGKSVSATALNTCLKTNAGSTLIPQRWPPKLGSHSSRARIAARVRLFHYGHDCFLHGKSGNSTRREESGDRE